LLKAHKEVAKEIRAAILERRASLRIIITILGGKELSWICLGSCSIDISINALVVYAVTKSRRGRVLRSASSASARAILPVRRDKADQYSERSPFSAAKS
jgi:hypothetical protein